MKTVLKSVFAVLIIAGFIAACTTKSETTVKQDTIPVDTTSTKVTQPDTTATADDSVVVK